MANPKNSTYPAQVMNYNLLSYEGSFYTNSGSAPSDVRGKGFTVASGTMTNTASRLNDCNH